MIIRLIVCLVLILFFSFGVNLHDSHALRCITPSSDACDAAARGLDAECPYTWCTAYPQSDCSDSSGCPPVTCKCECNGLDKNFVDKNNPKKEITVEALCKESKDEIIIYTPLY